MTKQHSTSGFQVYSVPGIYWISPHCQKADLLAGAMVLDNLGFLVHILVETPASFNFFFFPSKQLGAHTPQAHAVIRQYAVLLLSSVFLAAIFVARDPDDMSSKVAATLALYHVAPLVRSLARLHRQAQARAAIILSEAFLYLTVHSVCFAALLQHSWSIVTQEARLPEL